MGVPRTIGAVVASVAPGNPTPVYTGTVIAAVSFFIKNNIATINLGKGNMPANGYNGPNSAIQGNWPAPNGQQVTLWGFGTATYFNGKVVTVVANDVVNGSFSFYFTHANVGSFASPTSDPGNTAACPFQHYRAVRLECSQTNGTDFVYVGDLNVSSTRYVAALSLAGQLSVEVASENIPADRIFIDATTDTDSVQVSLIY
jgi:hypothetical protein